MLGGDAIELTFQLCCIQGIDFYLFGSADFLCLCIKLHVQMAILKDL